MPRASYRERLIGSMFASGAVIIDPQHPYKLRSGYLSPIYVENNMLLRAPGYRTLVAKGFRDMIMQGGMQYDIIAGLTTAPVSFSTTLADDLTAPLIYVNPQTRKLGGVSDSHGIQGKTVILLEDSVTTGGSLAGGVKAIRDAGGVVDQCLALVTYELPESRELFDSLNFRLAAQLTSRDLIAGAKRFGIAGDILHEVEAWQRDISEWSARHS